MKCLIADDSRIIRMVLAKIFSNLGFEVEEAEDGDEVAQLLLGATQSAHQGVIEHVLDEGGSVDDGVAQAQEKDDGQLAHTQFGLVFFRVTHTKLLTLWTDVPILWVRLLLTPDIFA